VSNFDSILDKELSLKPQFDKVKDDLKNVAVVIGGPPCQGFSMAGGRIRKVNEFIEDERNFLFKYYFKVIQKFEPQYFVFENVAGILSSHKGDIIKQIKEIFSDPSNFKKGAYNLSINLLNAADYGVPQLRKRVLIIGSKTDFDFNTTRNQVLAKMSDKEKERFLCKKTVRDAIADLEIISPYDSNDIPNHNATRHSAKALERISKIKPNENWTVLDEKINSIHSGSYGRLDWNKQATTITTRFDTPSAGRYIHPSLNRTITPREAARLQSFPDDYIFRGTKSSICTQIGNAVPPLLAEFVANMIKLKLDEIK
jgi:DNA (cytosine-5)-methyltransferase 1